MNANSMSRSENSLSLWERAGVRASDEAVPPHPNPLPKGEGIVSCRGRSHRRHRRAFSLLEVILALAILIGALAVIGELVRSGLRNAQVARDLSQAQLLCETRLAEIHAGAASSEGGGKSPIADHPGWLATVERETSSVQSGSSGSSSGGSGGGGSAGGSGGGQSSSGSQNFSGQVSLLKVRVTVEQDPAEYRNPVKFSLSQWMIDPSVTGVQLQPPVNPATSGNSQSGSSSGQGR